MRELVDVLALTCVISGFAMAFGALVRLAVDTWEARERARRSRDEADVIYGFHKSCFDSRNLNVLAMDTAWTDPEPVTVPAGTLVTGIALDLSGPAPVLLVETAPGPDDDAPALGGERAR